MSKPVPDTPPPISTGAVALSRTAAGRIAAATRKIEGFPTIGGPGFPIGGRHALIPTSLAKSTGIISARSGTTVGSGNADLWYLPDGSTTLTAGPTSITAYNLLNKQIASGSYLVVVWLSGRWLVVAVGDCANLS